MGRKALPARAFYRGSRLSDPALSSCCYIFCPGEKAAFSKAPDEVSHRLCDMGPPPGLRSLLREAPINVVFRRPPLTALPALARLYSLDDSRPGKKLEGRWTRTVLRGQVGMSDLSGRWSLFPKLCTPRVPKALNFQAQAHLPPEAVLTRLERNQSPGRAGTWEVGLQLVSLPKP